MTVASETFGRLSGILTPQESRMFLDMWTIADSLGKPGRVMRDDLLAAGQALVAWAEANPVTIDGYTEEQLAQRAAALAVGYRIVAEIATEHARPERLTEAQELAAALMEQDPAARQAGRDIAEARYAAWEGGYRTRMAGG